MISTTFILEGQVPAKKNSRQCFVRNGRMVNIPSKRYQEWHEDCIEQIKRISVPSLKPPYELTVCFWFKDKRPRDLDNVLASVCDLLQDTRVIENDDAKMLTRVAAVYGGVSKDFPRAKVELRSEINKAGDFVFTSGISF